MDFPTLFDEINVALSPTFLIFPKLLINSVNHKGFHLLVRPYFLSNFKAYPEFSTVTLSKLEVIFS